MNLLVAVLIAILNSLWQASLLAALLWLALRLTPALNAATRFAIWWIALGVVLGLPFAPHLIASVRNQFTHPSLPSAALLHVSARPRSQVPDMAPLLTVAEPGLERWPVATAVIWCLIFLFRVSRLIKSYLYLRGLKRRAFISGETLPATGRTASLLLSSEIDSPIAVGFAHPAVILPHSLAADLSREETHHVLLHEAAHLARWDDCTNLLACLLEAALALHPVATWILRRIEMEREAACDDWAVARARSARHYAQTLVHVCEIRFARGRTIRAILLASGIFGRRTRLAERIETLLRRGRNFAPRVSAAPLTVSAGALLLLGAIASLSPHWVAFAQVPRQTFEIASVKPSANSDGRALLQAVPGQLRVQNLALRRLILIAWELQDDQLAGDPPWANSALYDIQAKAVGNPTVQDMEVSMLQALLEDRFRLTFHREIRQLPVYDLAIARNGAKLPASQDSSCVLYSVDSPPPVSKAGEPGPNFCGFRNIPGDGLNRTLEGKGITMAALAKTLSRGYTTSLGRNVIDTTGLRGTYDVHLKWVADAPPNSAGPDAAAASELAGPSIFTALQEQLGLKLESTKGPAEVLVIDHIERPSAN